MNNRLNRCIAYIRKHSIVVIVIICILTVFFAYETMQIQINASYVSLIPPQQEPITYIVASGTVQQMDSPPTPFTSRSATEGETLTSSPAQDKIESGDINTMVQETDTQIKQPSATDSASTAEIYYESNYVVMIESDDLFRPELLTAIDIAIQNMSTESGIGDCFSIFNFITIDKRGTRLSPIALNPHTGTSAWTQAEAELFKQRVENDDIIQNVLISGDQTAILLEFEATAVSDATLASYREYFRPLEEFGATIIVNGGLVINERVNYYLSRDMVLLLSLCFIVILLSYYLSFRSKRSMLIPFSLSVIGIIWTVGTMSLLGYAMTIINIVTPCIVLTLGSSYSIHMLNEYYSSFNSHSGPEGTNRIFKTIFLACITTISGFLSLLISEMPAIREFGISVSIGIAYCAILSFTYLPAVLARTVQPKQKQLNIFSTGLLSKIVCSVGKSVTIHWKAILVIFLAVFAGFCYAQPRINVDANYMSYFPKSDPFGQESRHFANKLYGTDPYYVTITAPEGEKNFFQNPDNLKKVFLFEETIQRESDDIVHTISFPSYISFMNRVYNGDNSIPDSPAMMNLLSRLMVLLKQQMPDSILDMLINPEGTKLTIMIQQYDSSSKDLGTVSSFARIEETLKRNLSLLPNDTTIEITGNPTTNLRFSNTLLGDQTKTTVLSIILVFIIATIAFKSIAYGAYTLVPVLSGSMICYIFMFVLQIPFDVVTVSCITIAIGAGVDDAIHFIFRFKQQKQIDEKRTVTEILQRTIQETGRPIILTTISIVAGMLVLVFASYTPIRYFGILMSVILAGCMISTLTILPAMMIGINHLGALVKKKR